MIKKKFNSFYLRKIQFLFTIITIITIKKNSILLFTIRKKKFYPFMNYVLRLELCLASRIVSCALNCVCVNAFHGELIASQDF